MLAPPPRGNPGSTAEMYGLHEYGERVTPRGRWGGGGGYPKQWQITKILKQDKHLIMLLQIHEL